MDADMLNIYLCIVSLFLGHVYKIILVIPFTVNLTPFSGVQTKCTRHYLKRKVNYLTLTSAGIVFDFTSRPML